MRELSRKASAFAIGDAGAAFGRQSSRRGAPDRPFFVSWKDSGRNTRMQDLYFIDGQTGWAWQSYLSSLEETVDDPEGPESYLTALATCYKAYKVEFALPEVLFPAAKHANRAQPDGRRQAPQKPSAPA